MRSDWLRELLKIIEMDPTPELLDLQVDPKTGLVKWCQLLWSDDDSRTIRIYIFCDNNQAVVCDEQRLWVPLDNIQITGALGSQNPLAIGSGGSYCISFNEDCSGPVHGIKEALQAAISATEA